MKGKARGMHALTNTLSGVAGEARVAAAFIRCGFLIAKPYWNDDEVDLLLLHRFSLTPGSALPLPIQVKSIQFLPQKNGKVPKRLPIKGLKKRYLVKSPNLSLAIYRPDTDQIFFVHGAKRIKKLYEQQRKLKKGRKAFAELRDEDDVRIVLDFQTGLQGDWLIDPNDRRWLTGRVNGLINEIEQSDPMVSELDQILMDEELSRESLSDSGDAQAVD